MGWGKLNPFKPGSVYEQAGQGASRAVSSVGSVLAKIDPGPAIGKAGATLDKAVGEVIPGGWITVGAIALVVAAPYLAPQLSAYSASAAASEAALAAGATAAEAAAAGQAASAASLAGAAGTTTGAATGVASGAIGAGAATPTALQTALAAAGKGALVGGALGGGSAAIQGGDPLKAALKGAFYGGVTAGVTSGLSSGLSALNATPAGANSYISKTLTSLGTGALQGKDLSTMLQNTALNSGLSQLSSYVPAGVNSAVTNAATGAIGSAIKGGDPLTGAVTGAAGSLINQGVNAAKPYVNEGANYLKDQFNSLTAPSASAVGEGYDSTPTVNLAGVGEMGTDLAGRYLSSAAGELADKVADLMPSIEEQRAALLSQANTIQSQFEDAAQAQKALESASNEFQNSELYKNVVGMQSTAESMYSQIQEAQSTYDQNKAAYQSSGNTNTAAFNAANAAAAQLNELIPQYNTIANDYQALNTQLTEVFNSSIQPLVQEFQTVQNALTDSVASYQTAQAGFDETVDTASSYLTGLNDISQGKLPTDYNAAALSMSAPTTQGFNNEELAAIEQGQQDAVNAAGTGTQTASNNGIGYVTVNPVPNENATTTPVAPSYPEGTTENPDGSITVQNPDGSIDNYDAAGNLIDSTPPVDQEQDSINQVILDQIINSATPTPAAPTPVPPTPVEPTPVSPTPVEPTPVPPTPVEPTPVPPIPVAPTPVEPAPVTPAPVEPAPVEPAPVTPTPVEPAPVEPNIPFTPAPPTPIGSVTNPDGSITTYNSDGTSNVTVVPVTPVTPGGDSNLPGGSGGVLPGGDSTLPGGNLPGGDVTLPGGNLPVPEEPAPVEPTAPPGGTTTGGGTSTGTGGGGTSTGTGATNTGTGGVRAPTTGGLSAISRPAIKDLTPQLTKSSAFKFANTPTYSSNLSPMTTPTPFDYTSQIFNAAAGGSTSSARTIADLKPQLTERRAFEFAQNPDYETPLTNIPVPAQFDYTQQILNAAQGGLIQGYAMGDQVGKVEGVDVLSPQIMRGRKPNPLFQSYRPQQYAEGGDVQEHNPQFFSEGGLNSLDNTYVTGDGDGTSDSVPAMLANGEFVIPADVVSKLGNGSNDSGASVLSEFLATIREHAQNHDPKDLPPESKGALAYLLDAKRKVG